MELQDVQRNYDAAAAYYDVATDLVFHRLLGLRRLLRQLRLIRLICFHRIILLFRLWTDFFMEYTSPGAFLEIQNNSLLIIRSTCVFAFEIICSCTKCKSFK